MLVHRLLYPKNQHNIHKLLHLYMMYIKKLHFVCKKPVHTLQRYILTSLSISLPISFYSQHKRLFSFRQLNNSNSHHKHNPNSTYRGGHDMMDIEYRIEMETETPSTGLLCLHVHVARNRSEKKGKEWKLLLVVATRQKGRKYLVQGKLHYMHSPRHWSFPQCSVLYPFACFLSIIQTESTWWNINTCRTRK